MAYAVDVLYGVEPTDAVDAADVEDCRVGGVTVGASVASGEGWVVVGRVVVGIGVAGAREGSAVGATDIGMDGAVDGDDDGLLVGHGEEGLTLPREANQPAI